MKNKQVLVSITVLLIVSLSCNFLFPNSSNGGQAPTDFNKVFGTLPVYDPKAPLTSISATALRGLIKLDPSVAVLESEVEASDRAAMKDLLANLKIQLGAGNGSVAPALASQPGMTKVTSTAAGAWYPVGYKRLGGLDGPANFSFDAMFVSILVSQLSDSLAVLPGADYKPGTGQEGGANSKNGLTFHKNPDGSTTMAYVNQTDASKGGVSAKEDGKVSIDGWRCPNEAGQVSFTIKERFNSESGGASYTVDLTANIQAEVNDNAEIVSTAIDITQGTRMVKGGRNVYVESGAKSAGLALSNQRVIRSSQDASASDVSDLSSAGENAANYMALGSLLFAKDNWLKGGCTKIVATSPGTVKPGSTSSIPVSVIQRIDGSEISTKLVAALSGGQSIDPTSLPKTPGSLTYTAPGETGKSATITLTSTSKRGKATLELTASTGGAAYHIFGTLGEASEDGYACDATQPFTITGTVTMVFTPTDEKSGTFKFANGPFADRGGGTYTIADGSLQVGGGGCIDSPKGTFCNNGAGTLTATPIDPATCHSQ